MERKRLRNCGERTQYADCDGTELPDHPEEIAPKVYKTYFLARGNNAWAYAHDEALQMRR